MSALKNLINLVKKMGDKAIIADLDGNPECVLMTVGDYEALTLGSAGVKGLTEEELLAKINRDIAMWKDSQGKSVGNIPIERRDFASEILPPPEYTDISTPAAELAQSLGFDEYSPNLDKKDDQDEDRYYFEPVE